MTQKRPRSMICLGIGILVFLMVYYSVQAYLVRHSDEPQVQDGVLDLREWDFANNGTIQLNGTWAFYWQQLLVPGEKGERRDNLRVPGQWNRQGYPVNGAATYRMTLKVKPSSEMYGLRISNIQMASAVYVDGIERGRSGFPALVKEDYIPENKPYTVYFPIAGDSAEIVLHVANYDFINSGVTYSIKFGNSSAIQAADQRITGIDIAVVVALLMIGLYHLGVYLRQRTDRSLLYFGLYCTIGAFAFACLSDKLFMQVFPMLSFSVSYKLQLFTINSLMPLLTLFVRSISSGNVPSWFYRTVIAVFGSFMVFGAITPYPVYTRFTFVFSALQAIVYILFIAMLSASHIEREGRYNRQSLRLLILAICGALVCLIDNSIYILGWLPNNYLGSVSILLFAVAISAMLSFRFSDAYKTIEGMSERLLEADRRKDEFLINTSHELQTPLNAILNISQWMQTGRDGPVSEGQKGNLAVIEDAARRLTILVGDILDLERIKRNDLRLLPQAVDVHSAAAVVLDMLGYLAEDKELRLINRVPPGLAAVHADEHRLRQVLSNLIANAIKFTEKGIVEVGAERSGRQIKITVQDTGIGIAPSEWRRMFQSFAQGDTESAAGNGGIGLGLSISRQLVELMMGEIFVEASEPGLGTRMAVLLPVAQDQPVAPPMAPAPLMAAGAATAAADVQRPETVRQREGASFTILAVDDEPVNLHILRNLFAGEEFRLLTADHGLHALRIMEATPDIDLVLLDVMMPELSGYEVCRQLRHRFTLFDLPVVMMTVRNTPHDIAAGFAAGANDYIVKPYNAWEVLARVKTLLALKRSVHDAFITEMAFLQSQIKPHFLFNALNAIVSICYTDSARAAGLMNHLSHYLRKSFDWPGTDGQIALDDELKLVESYVEIEKARFEERLTMLCEVDESLRACRIPPLTIQPLVENAIRHGIMKRKQGGTVKLKVKRKKTTSGDMVDVEVQDDGMGIAAEQLLSLLDHTKTDGRRGVGLLNIHRRLLSLNGEGIQIRSKPGEGTSVRFCIKEQ